MLNDIEVKFSAGAMKINLMCLLLPLRLSPYWLDQLDLILTEQLVVNNIENKLTEPNMNVSSASCLILQISSSKHRAVDKTIIND